MTHNAEKSDETVILEISIRKLSEAFDKFIGECIAENGTPKSPDKKALMRARG